MEQEVLYKMKEKYEQLKKESTDEVECYVLRKAFETYIKEIKKTNEIWVYISSYKLSFDFELKQVSRGSQDELYRSYLDLEKKENNLYITKEYSSFEKDNLVVGINNKNNIKSFYKIRNEFLRDSILDSQEIAKEKIIKKYK